MHDYVHLGLRSTVYLWLYQWQLSMHPARGHGNTDSDYLCHKR